MTSLLARTWRGTTRAADADAYLAYLHATGLAAYAAAPGNRGVFALRRVDGEHAEWLLVTLWDSPDAVRAFTGSAAGDDAALTRAVFYPEDDRFLTAGDARATHYEVVHASVPAALAPDAVPLPGDASAGPGTAGPTSEDGAAP